MKIALKFCTALDLDDSEEALCLFKSASLDTNGMQSLKEKSFFDSREWYSKDKLQIRLITGSHCNGKIGSALISPSGVD